VHRDVHPPTALSATTSAFLLSSSSVEVGGADEEGVLLMMILDALSDNLHDMHIYGDFDAVGTAERAGTLRLGHSFSSFGERTHRALYTIP
jgi:hypothetical protein